MADNTETDLRWREPAPVDLEAAELEYQDAYAAWCTSWPGDPDHHHRYATYLRAFERLQRARAQHPAREDG